jgi:raffinose/stachyose/melibiose transport system substrate-binding protein
MITMKKAVVFLAALTLPLSMAAAGGGGQKAAVITLSNAKIEIDSGLKKAAARYHELNPGVTIEVLSALEAPGSAELKARFAGGQGPDIFSISGNNQLNTWETYLEDLSDQSWVKDMAEFTKPGITKDNRIYGMPLCVEGGAYMYNKDMFKKAGITEIPKTRSAFAAALQKLKSAGFNPIIADGGWYAMGAYDVSYGFANQDNPQAFIDSLNRGAAKIPGNPKFIEMAEYFKWEGAQIPNIMALDFQLVVSMMANQEAAICFGGNWNQKPFDAVDPNLQIGLMPVPMTENAAANDFLFAWVNDYWCVNKNSPLKKEAKDFLTWLVTSQEGRDFLTKDMALLPAFTSFRADPKSSGMLTADLEAYVAQGKVKSTYHAFFPDGGHQAFGEATQKLVSGRADVGEYLNTLQSEWERLSR